MKDAKKASKSGSRHTLLFYRRSMDRIWQATLALGLVLGAAVWWALLKPTTILGLHSDIWLTLAAVISLALCVFAFFARYLAYVRVLEDALQVVLPFLRFKISFRRIRGVRPVTLQQLFPPKEVGWAQRSFLEPFYGKTVLVVETQGYPLDPTLLKLFLPSAMFYPQTSGLVLMVPDWMKLSTEIDSQKGVWLQNQGRRNRGIPR